MHDLKNPIFILACCLFTAHQFSQKIFSINLPLINNYLDDILFIPILLTLMLAERKTLFRKTKDFQFSWLDTALLVIVFAVLFEEIVPKLHSGFTKDYLDYFCYFLGGLIFYFLINKKQNIHPNSIYKSGL